MPIEMRDFSSGWIPSDDLYNGRKNGFFRMDNCCLDENGAVTMVRGSTKLTGSDLADAPHTIFSRYLGSTLYRYAALKNGSVVRDAAKAGTFATSLLTGGSTLRADFAAALDQVFVVSGSKYKKDDGTDITNIGVTAPTAPTASQYAHWSIIDLRNLDGSDQFTNWTCDIGVLTYNNINNDIRWQTDATSFQSTIRTVFASPIDLTTYPSEASFPTTGLQLLIDKIRFFLSVEDATQLLSVTLNLYTFDPGASPGTNPAGAYYSKTWNYTDSPTPWASNLWNKLQANVEDFVQYGDNSQNYWNSIKAVTLSVVAASQINLGLTELWQQGSDRAALDGRYKYYTQNVVDTGKYEALSAISTATDPLISANGALQLTLTPPTDVSVTGVNIYRQNVDTQNEATFIAQVDPATTSYIDGLADFQQLERSSQVANLFLTSIQSIPDSPVLAIVGLYLGRMIYFTESQIYISDFLNPDAYDSRYVIKYSGETSEKFLWARKVSNKIIYVGTTYDIYQITGTFSTLPDGTLDATIIPLGVQYPPVSEAVACESGMCIYLANDGWRLLGAYGDDSTSISQDLSLLYRATDRYGILAILAGFNDTILTRCTLNKGRLFSVVTLSDNSTIILVYDVAKKYWYPISGFEIISLFTEEDGTLLVGSDDKNIYEFDTHNNYLFDGANQDFYLQTPIFDGGTPRQRKDTYTIKIRANTNGSAVTLDVYDGSSILLNSYPVTITGEFELEIDCPEITLFKSYYFVLRGNASYIKLFYIKLEYTDRPEQLTRLRLAPANMGSSGKKRMFTCPPFVIDTLGNNVTFQAQLDGTFVAVSNPTINTTEKTTIVPTFSEEKLAMDAGGLLTGGPFEFYGQFIDDWVVEKIPAGRLVDQIGPAESLRLAFLERFRYRCIAEGSEINYVVFVEDNNSYSGSFTTTPNIDKTYEIVLPKGLNGTTFRIVLSSASLIHRYSAKVKLRITGGATEGKWV